jgi:hypothetical protein
VVEIRHNNQVVFQAGAKPAPLLYIHFDVEPVSTDGEGESLSLPSLMGRTVATASISGGVILLTFADGATLRCDPDLEYEAWHVEGGSPESLIVCCPGGELSVWDETPALRYSQLRELDPVTAAALDEMFEQSNLPRPAGFPPPDKKPRRPWRVRKT